MSDLNNPPAFPRDERYIGHNGMSLQDWFAGQAMAGFAARADYWESDWQTWADLAYDQAEALLEARRKSA